MDNDQMEEALEQGYEDISPSFKGDSQKPKSPKKPKETKPKKPANKAADAVAKPAEKVAKKGAKQIALAVGRAIAHALSVAVSALSSVVGWPVLVGCLVVFIIILAIFGGLAIISINGYFGSTFENPAGPNHPAVKKLLDLNQETARTTNLGSYHRLDFLSNEDKDYVASGKIDERLAEALAYIADRHNRIAVSHIISAYKDMSTNPESGADRDPQIVNNVTVHQRGEAADVSEIDFVYKVFEGDSKCNANGAEYPIGDIVYYSDGTASAKDQNIFEDSNGQALTSDNLNAIIDNLISKINANLDNLNQTVNDTQATINNNSSAINNILNDDQKKELANLLNDLNQTNVVISDLKVKVAETLNKVKDFNTHLNNIRDTLDGLPLESAELTSFSDQITTIQKTMFQAIKKIDEVNNLIENLNEKLGADQNSLIQFLTEGQNDQVALTNIFQNINNDLALVRGMNNISNLSDLELFNTNIDYTKLITDKLTQMLKDNLLDDWSENYGDLIGKVGELSSLVSKSSDELLREYCMGTIASVIPNATIKNKPALAIPIKVSWQDRKPNVTHVSTDSDEAIGADPLVYSMVYQPEARKKVHQVISELLQFPYDKGDTDYYRVTQLITYSEKRDVTPFASLLDKLYSIDRPNNFGLFVMPEAWAQIHIGY